MNPTTAAPRSPTIPAPKPFPTTAPPVYANNELDAVALATVEFATPVVALAVPVLLSAPQISTTSVPNTANSYIVSLTTSSCAGNRGLEGRTLQLGDGAVARCF